MGTDIVRYDIYGNDVYIANKMESNGKPGFVNISEKMKNLIETKYFGIYAFEKNKDIFISNTGENVGSYFITKLVLNKEN